MDTFTLQRKAPTSLAADLAAFFRARPGQWIDGRNLTFAGSYAWRTRISDCRKAPYLLTIHNRQRRVRRADGSAFTLSEYRYVQEDLKTGSAAAGAEDAHCSV